MQFYKLSGPIMHKKSFPKQTPACFVACMSWFMAAFILHYKSKSNFQNAVLWVHLFGFLVKIWQVLFLAPGLRPASSRNWSILEP